MDSALLQLSVYTDCGCILCRRIHRRDSQGVPFVSKYSTPLFIFGRQVQDLNDAAIQYPKSQGWSSELSIRGTTAASNADQYSGMVYLRSSRTASANLCDIRVQTVHDRRYLSLSDRLPVWITRSVCVCVCAWVKYKYTAPRSNSIKSCMRNNNRKMMETSFMLWKEQSLT